MLFLTLFAIFSQVILAQNYYITNPVQGSVFNADIVETILWNKLNDPQLSDVKLIRIELVDADSNNARFVKLIVDLPSNASSYDWKVPNDLVPKSDYFLRMSARSKNGNVVYNYSARFSILGGSGTYKVQEKNDKKGDSDNGGDDSNDANNNSLDVMIIFGVIFNMFLI